MIRGYSCRQGMCGITLVVVFLLATPLQAADDYSFLSPQHLYGGYEIISEIISVPMEDGGSDHKKCCSCAICMESLGESFAPKIEPPGLWVLLNSTSLNVVSSLYRPGILRPPIA